MDNSSTATTNRRLKQALLASMPLFSLGHGARHQFTGRTSRICRDTSQILRNRSNHGKRLDGSAMAFAIPLAGCQGGYRIWDARYRGRTWAFLDNGVMK